MSNLKRLPDGSMYDTKHFKEPGKRAYRLLRTDMVDRS